MATILLGCASTDDDSTLEPAESSLPAPQAAADQSATPQAPSELARSDAELAIAWWEWAAQEPDPTNPVVDQTGEHCARNQPEDVWFLAGNFGGTTRRACAVPADRELFLPVLNQICGPDDGCEAWLDDAMVFAAFDGLPVEVLEIDTDPAIITTADSNSVTGTGGEFAVVAAGWWIRLPPSAPGPHTLEITGESTSGFALSVTYDLLVE